MKRILESIDNYLLIKEKDENIRSCHKAVSKNTSIEEIIEIIVKNKNKQEEILLSLDKDKREQIQKFIDGEIL
jgi:hypothetical protein